MIVPAEFDDIRPYQPEEIPQAVDELEKDEEFRAVIEKAYPDVPFDELIRRARSCKSLLEFQKTIPYGFMERLIESCTDGIDFDYTGLQRDKNYTFISNHRDIVLDSAFLAKLLVDNGFTNTVEIAIGDNLLARPWIRRLVRLNKSFIVKRSASGRERLLSSMQLGRYMHFAITEKHENIWIAQRQGRAKDSDDRTQDTVLKMMAFGGSEDTVQGRLCELHIVPLSISYEFDPCDFLKAREFWKRHLDPSYRKTREEDVLSMQTGINGYKGRVHYQATRPLDKFLNGLPDNIVRNDLFRIIAEQIDRQIHTAYHLFPNNYIAYDMLTDTQHFYKKYTSTELHTFEDYLGWQLEKVAIPNADETFLRNSILQMYANPLINYYSAIGNDVD